MDIWPQTPEGWVGLIVMVLWFLFMTRLFSHLWPIHNPADAAEPPEPEILDPLEEEFRELEARVEARQPIERRLRQVADNMKAHIATGTLRCSHLRLDQYHRVFVCRDCKQVVQVRAKPLA